MATFINSSDSNKGGIPVPTQVSQSSPLQQAMPIPQPHLVPVTSEFRAYSSVAMATESLTLYNCSLYALLHNQ